MPDEPLLSVGRRRSPTTALIVAGGPTIAEIRPTSAPSPSCPASRLPRAGVPFFRAIPDGRACCSGYKAISLIDAGGTGTLASPGARDATTATSATRHTTSRTLPRDVAEPPRRERRPDLHLDHATLAPEHRSQTGCGPIVSQRRQRDLTIFADGSLLATGGQTGPASAGSSASQSVYAAER